MLFSGSTVVILVVLFVIYAIFEKYCETKQIQYISNMDWLTPDQIDDLIDKIKK
jgi:hypothetical protein